MQWQWTWTDHGKSAPLPNGLRWQFPLVLILMILIWASASSLPLLACAWCCCGCLRLPQCPLLPLAPSPRIACAPRTRRRRTTRPSVTPRRIDGSHPHPASAALVKGKDDERLYDKQCETELPSPQGWKASTYPLPCKQARKVERAVRSTGKRGPGGRHTP